MDEFLQMPDEAADLEKLQGEMTLESALAKRLNAPECPDALRKKSPSANEPRKPFCNVPFPAPHDMAAASAGSLNGRRPNAPGFRGLESV